MSWFEGLLDGMTGIDAARSEVQTFTRRAVIGVLAGGTVGAFTAAGQASAAAASHTLWMLNPNWGSPLTTDSGSDTKSRCRGNACHKAAPNRFFLTEADALAGRLHKCCLAQPTPITVCIDLNELMPFYRARHGGVDARCPDLPASVRSALLNAAACIAQPDPSNGGGSMPVAGGDTAPLVAAAAAVTGIGGLIVVAARAAGDDTTAAAPAAE